MSHGIGIAISRFLSRLVATGPRVIGRFALSLFALLLAIVSWALVEWVGEHDFTVGLIVTLVVLAAVLLVAAISELVYNRPAERDQDATEV